MIFHPFRHVALIGGRDLMQGPHAWSISLFAVDRGASCAPGQYRFRLNLTCGATRLRDGRWSIYHNLVVIPAWQDVVSVRAEFDRTMRR